MLAIVLQLLSLSLARDLLPKTVDWRTEGVVSPVKNQLAYNNSWAFAGTGALEGAMKITTGVLYSLSEQQLIDCIPANLTLSNEDNTIEQAFKYVRDNGLCMEADYNYTGKPSKCNNSCKSVVNITNYASLNTGDVLTTERIMQYVLNLQPIAVSIDSNCLRSYVSGVIADTTCYQNLNYNALIVGYNTELHVGYWIVKADFGSDWGEAGYFRVAMFYNIMGIAENPILPIARIP
jgi:C1A family cysteine protease